jgi:hypothetical protein
MPIEMRRVFESLDADQTMSGSAVGVPPPLPRPSEQRRHPRPQPAGDRTRRSLAARTRVPHRYRRPRTRRRPTQPAPLPAQGDRREPHDRRTRHVHRRGTMRHRGSRRARLESSTQRCPHIHTSWILGSSVVDPRRASDSGPGPSGVSDAASGGTQHSGTGLWLPGLSGESVSVGKRDPGGFTYRRGRGTLAGLCTRSCCGN